ADATGEDLGPIEVPRLEQGAGLVGPVVENDRRTDALAAVAEDGGNVRSADAVVLKPLVERRDAGLAHPRLHQLANAVVDHGRGDAGPQSEAIGQVRGYVVLAAGNVDLHGPRLAKREHAGVEPMHEGA